MKVYRCDVCLKIVGPTEVLSYPETTPSLRPDYNDVIEWRGKSIRLAAKVGVEGGSAKDVCFACMWKEVKDLVAKFGPADTDTERPESGQSMSVLWVSGGMPPTGFSYNADFNIHFSAEYKDWHSGVASLCPLCSTRRSSRASGGSAEETVRGASGDVAAEGVTDSGA